MEVNSLRSWFRALTARLGAKAFKKLKWTIVMPLTASKAIVQHEVLNFQPALLA